DRRGEGPHLRDHGRHGRHRRHAGEGRRGAEGRGREEGGGVLHARGAVGPGASSHMDELVVTDTIPLSEEARKCRKIRQLSVAGLIAETILRIYTEESVSSLFI